MNANNSYLYFVDLHMLSNHSINLPLCFVHIAWFLCLFNLHVRQLGKVQVAQ